MASDAPTYRELLEEARELGRLDGRFAAAFEPSGAEVSAGRCLGRTPEDFARLLWARRHGAPPVGLELNAPLWYAAGFAEAVAEATARSSDTAGLWLRRVLR
ncbi:hypothetical protein [Blastococcus brunescens]|uniref:Uncharacterized protein n=1 Tax=Blastococcus brunescens TaxID=1564165 RepID=A0ABZ1B2C6_9ACTN|nr:hypothetical protein [Blastococcus sp. BMG 8361]WRL64976.1 hypothetical protein U6N30_04485 [Blastococcus sp. BMG 8361]